MIYILIQNFLMSGTDRIHYIRILNTDTLSYIPCDPVKVVASAKKEKYNKLYLYLPWS